MLCSLPLISLLVIVSFAKAQVVKNEASVKDEKVTLLTTNDLITEETGHHGHYSHGAKQDTHGHYAKHGGKTSSYT